MKTSRLLRLALANVMLGLLVAPAAGQLPALRWPVARGAVVATDRVLDRNPGAVPGSAAATPVARQLLIRGHVADQDARAVAGAAVVLVGTAMSTTTSASGDFTLAVPTAVLSKLPAAAPVRLLLTYPGYAARGVELAPRPADLVGIVQLMVTVGPGAVQVVRTPTKRPPLARVIRPLPGDSNAAVPPRRGHAPPSPSPPPPSPPPPPPPTPTAGEEPTIRSGKKKRANAFTWPPPHPSAFCVLPDKFFSPNCRRLSQVDTRLKVALKKAHFHAPAYYGIPDGFAMVTSIEQLDGDDNPLPGTNRWAPEEVHGAGLADFLRSLVSARTGRFRVLVFAVTASPFAPTEEPVTKAQAMAWLDGTTTLPPAIGQLPWTADSHCTTLVYEFEKQENHAAALVAASRYSGQEHLAKAGITIEP